MKNYDPHSQEFFETNAEEIEKLENAWNHRENYSYGLMRVQRKWPHFNIKDLTVRELPYKKSRYDNAKLLIVHTEDNKLLAKRFHNNQHLSVEKV